MGILQKICDTFWSETIWLPPNATWADIAPGARPDIDHADYRDLWWPIPMALALLIIRYCVETWVLKVDIQFSFFNGIPRRKEKKLHQFQQKHWYMEHNLNFISEFIRIVRLFIFATVRCDCLLFSWVTNYQIIAHVRVIRNIYVISKRNENLQKKT